MRHHPAEAWSTLVDGNRVTLEIGTSRILRLRVAAEHEHQKDFSYAVIRNRWPEVRKRIIQETGFVRIETDDLRIELRSLPFSMKVMDAGGKSLFETRSPGLIFDERGATLVRKMPSQESVYGMGEVGETFDRAGERHTLWNIDDWARNARQNFYCQMPFSIQLDRRSSCAFGLFIDNPGKTVFDLGKTQPGAASYRTVTGDLEFWLLFSGSIREVLTDWVDLTGKMDRPPLWALGYHQCRWSYYPESRIRSLAREFRKRRIPCDAIYLDIEYMDDFRVFTWHPKRFPKPAKLVGDLAKQGFRTVTIVDPGVKIDPQYDVYQAFAEGDGHFCMDPETGKPYVGRVWPGETHFPDFTREDVRRLWGEYQEKTLLDPGVAGIWNDMNEPHTFDEKEFPGRVIQHDFGRNRTHERVHQVYGHCMAQASRDGFRRARPRQRPFVITRSGWAGVQRHALVWTGDNQSTWASMALDLQLNLSMGLSAVSFVGCDIGGFGLDGCSELYARWIEWGVFQPFCRTHTSIRTIDQEPWSFGPQVEAVARKMIETRMRLLPYMYSAFVEASETGAPVNRPLVYQYPADRQAQRIADQFLLGRDLLVAPVLQPAADRRMVYFPEGEWVDWWTGNRHSGMTWRIVDAPLGQPPVFARAGAVIPTQEALQHTGAKRLPETTLEVFVAGKIDGDLVEDDGNTRKWEEGFELRTRFSGNCTGKRIEFVIHEPTGKYTGPRKHWRIRLHSVPGIPVGVTCNGRKAGFVHRDGAWEFFAQDRRRETRFAVVLK